MRKLLFPLLTLLASACSPLVYSLQLDVRQPSASGLDLSRKTMAIVTMETPDSLFDRATASAMARALEQDYFGGEELIGMYRIPAVDSVSLEKMHSLVMDTEYDVIFVLSSTLGPAQEDSRIPLNTSLKVYDSMGKEDVIHKYKGTTNITSADDAEAVGNRIATRFLSQWKPDSFSLYYFDDFSSYQWEKALRYAYQGQYSNAVDVWIELAKGGNAIKQAAACYNIAMAFYLLEDDRMAVRWLDKADSIENLSLSPGLRKRINARLEK